MGGWCSLLGERINRWPSRNGTASEHITSLQRARKQLRSELRFVTHYRPLPELFFGGGSAFSAKVVGLRVSEVMD